jgi:hypothetical protein
VDDWKQEIGEALDRAAQETSRFARELSSCFAREAREGRESRAMPPHRPPVQQGCASRRAPREQAARRSSLLSQRRGRAMAEALQEVADAARAHPAAPRGASGRGGRDKAGGGSQPGESREPGAPAMEGRPAR